MEEAKQNVLRKSRIGIALLAAVLFAAAATYAVPRAADAVSGLDDPVRVASGALDGAFDAMTARREIEAALTAQDAELAQSFIDLASVRHVAIDPALAEKVAAATAEAATMRYRAKSFARGLVTGKPQDMASLAGTTLGDLFVFGDIRDALREGTRYVRGEQVDQLVLGLAATGIAITAGTYATFGAATPARAGLTLVKAARKSGRLGAEFTESLGRMVRQTSFPAAARTARETAKVERAGGLLHLVRDVGRVEKAAGGRAALDALKIAKEPQRHHTRRQARRKGRQPHAGDSQDRGAQRDHACGARFRCKPLASWCAVCRIGFCICAQRCGRTHGAANLSPATGTTHAQLDAADCRLARSGLDTAHAKLQER